MTIIDGVNDAIIAKPVYDTSHRDGSCTWHGDGSTEDALRPPMIAVIEPRVLVSQCLIGALQAIDPDTSFKVYGSVDAWENSPERYAVSLVLLCIPGGEGSESAVLTAERDLAQLQTCKPRVLYAVMSDQEDPEWILKAIESGASGFIPTSLSLEVAVQVLQLVRAGGIFVPASSLVALANLSQTKDSTQVEENTYLLSARQLSVAKALRRGMPNKLIAYELNMCESTVKVHVRTIMKKLRAKNRTEAALLTNKLFPEEG